MFYKNKYLIIFPILTTFCSCTIEKRIHNKGFHVEWNNKKFENSTVQENYDNKPNQNVIRDTINLDLSSIKDESFNIPSGETIFEKKKIQLIKSKMNFESEVVDCDVIFFIDGSEEQVKVELVSEEAIKYKMCGDEDGALFSISPSKIFMIKFASGHKEVFNDGNQNINNNVKSTKKQSLEIVKETEIFGILSILLTIISIPLWIWVSLIIGLILAILAVIFGIVNLSKNQSNPEKYKSRYIGLISCFLGFLVLVGTIIFGALNLI
jgi:hypothetical protein